MAIPTVKTWKVAVTYKDGRRGCALIDAPNKRFAVWNAARAFGDFFWASPHVEKITISRLRCAH